MTSCWTPRRQITWRRWSRPGAKLGLAWVELSTGRFSLTGLLRTELADEIARLNPSEILISELSLDAPWARLLRGQSVALDDAALVGLSARAGAEDALRPFPDRRPSPASASTTAASKSRPPVRSWRICAIPRNRRWATSPG